MYGKGKHPTGRRGRVVALMILTALMLTTSACTKDKPASGSREVADRFMDLYYARMNMAEAVKLCSGAAKNQLATQINNVKGVQPDQPGGEPRVTFELTTSENPSPSEASYTYLVTPRTSDVTPLLSTLTLSMQDGGWTVSALSEKQAPKG